MANYFRLAYALGRTHTSMLAYLCELHKDGELEPLRTFLSAIGLSPATCSEPLTYRFEGRGADLALFGGEHCFLMVEMKVDDREGWKKVAGSDVVDTTHTPYTGLKAYAKTDHERQTELYRQRGWRYNREQDPVAAPPTVLLVTLGVGELGVVPEAEGSHIRHIGLDAWRAAFAKTLHTVPGMASDAILQQYVAALELEQAHAAWAISDVQWKQLDDGESHDIHAGKRSRIRLPCAGWLVT